VKTFKTVDDYIDAALTTARFERIEGGQKMYAEIPTCRGVWAQGRTRQQVKEELREVLKAWIELQIEGGGDLPPIKGSVLKELTFA
jgi:predicted RNase H-like HicB family nuclease